MNLRTAIEVDPLGERISAIWITPAPGRAKVTVYYSGMTSGPRLEVETETCEPSGRTLVARPYDPEVEMQARATYPNREARIDAAGLAEQIAELASSRLVGRLGVLKPFAGGYDRPSRIIATHHGDIAERAAWLRGLAKS